MFYKADSPDHYIDQIPEERREPIQKLRKVIKDNLPEGFKEVMNYGMIGYVVPHSIYPPGYHCNPQLPLPFMNIASQKNFISIYHMGIYAIEELLNWFTIEYGKHMSTKLDIGKSCIRFKKIDQLPYELIGQLASKINVDQWISTYESNLKE